MKAYKEFSKHSDRSTCNGTCTFRNTATKGRFWHGHTKFPVAIFSVWAKSSKVIVVVDPSTKTFPVRNSFNFRCCKSCKVLNPIENSTRSKCSVPEFISSFSFLRYHRNHPPPLQLFPGNSTGYHLQDKSPKVIWRLDIKPQTLMTYGVLPLPVETTSTREIECK